VAQIDAQEIDLDGLSPAYSAAAGGGDTFVPDEDTFLHIKNASGAPLTVTVATPNTVEGLAIADAAVAVAAGGAAFLGPFPKQHFARSADGLASITYSGVTTLTLAVVKAPRRR
jgi:hypothetical protein